MTEAWFRNPHNYVRELVEEREGKIAFDRGILVNKHIDIDRWLKLYYADPTLEYRVLLVGEQGTAELTRNSDTLHPAAVYPTWEYTDPWAQLEELVATNIADDPDVTGDTSIPPDLRPVPGQEHRVVVTQTPLGNTGPGRKFFKELAELQRENPQCIIHVHGLYGFRIAFGLGYGAVDVEVRTSAGQGKVLLPMGRETKKEDLTKFQQWVHLLNFQLADLEIPRNRCIYNIRSANWAGKHFNDNLNFRSTTGGVIDPNAPKHLPVVSKSSPTGVAKAQEGDKYLCNSCSLSVSCKYYRAGAVCSVPGSEPTQLARFFQTRDSGSIIEGLGTVMAAQTRRLQMGMENEEIEGELDGEVTKIVNSLLTNGIKLAKLVDPTLTKPQVGVFIGNMTGNGGETTPVNPREVVAGVVRELEARGVRREDITPEMIARVLDPDAANRTAIESTVIASTSE